MINGGVLVLMFMDGKFEKFLWLMLFFSIVVRKFQVCWNFVYEFNVTLWFSILT